MDLKMSSGHFVSASVCQQQTTPWHDKVLVSNVAPCAIHIHNTDTLPVVTADWQKPWLFIWTHSTKYAVTHVFTKSLVVFLLKHLIFYCLLRYHQVYLMFTTIRIDTIFFSGDHPTFVVILSAALMFTADHNDTQPGVRLVALNINISWNVTVHCELGRQLFPQSEYAIAQQPWTSKTASQTSEFGHFI